MITTSDTTKTKEIIDNFLQEEKQKGTVRINAVRWSIRLLLEYLEEKSLDLALVGVPEAEEFQTWLLLTSSPDTGGRPRFSKRTIRNIVGVMVKFYEYLRMHGHAGFNPFPDIDRIKVDIRLPRNVPSEEEMDRLLAHFRKFRQGESLYQRWSLYKAHVMGEVLYATGMRIGEAVQLKMSDIDFRRKMIRVRDRKNRKKRECILNDYAAEVLKIYSADMRQFYLSAKNARDRELVFGSIMTSAKRFNIALRQACPLLELSACTSHSFRHAVGTHLLKNGCDIRYIQDILGHDDLSSTQVYTRVDKSDLRSVLDNFHPRKSGQW